MSIESIHSRHPESPKGPAGTRDLPARAVALETEFEQFLCDANEQEAGAGSQPHSLRAWLDLAEAWKITKALRECRGNRSAAARSLGIGRRTLYAKMEKLRIAPTWAMGSLPRGRSDR